MAAPRRVEPEILDDLCPTDPRAIASRADLRRINSWMLQTRLMARLLRRYGPTPPGTILELGSGDGTFMLRVARRLAPLWPSVTVRLLDRQPVISAETCARFARLGWRAEPVTADVFDALHDDCERADIVTANLFLHHFETEALRTLLVRAAAKATFFAACEPRRSRLALAGSRMVFALGCNDVTRNDAVSSVRAGFSGNELSRLWAAGEAGGSWSCVERGAGLFTHTFVALSTAARVSA